MKNKRKGIWAVILAGGSGKRLWPLSRKSFPKQFINLGESSSLIADSVKRALSLDGLEGILIVAGESHVKLIQESLNSLSTVQDLNYSILVEPESRNTAPAIFAAAQYINSLEKDATMIVLPSDHFYSAEDFSKTISIVKNDMSYESIITLGVKPTSPEVGYGYIQYLKADSTIKKVSFFKEKPDLKTAKEYLASEEFYWNSGIFIFFSKFILEEFNDHLPESRGVSLIFQMEGNLINIDKNEFKKLPDISIDYSLLEKSKNTFTTEFLGDWTDLGSWHSLREIKSSDKSSNTALGGEAYFQDSDHNIVLSDSKVIGISGLNNIAVVDTKDALLITNLEKREDSAKLLDEISEKNPEIFSTGKRVFRPWGWYESIDFGDKFQVKKIHVYPNEQLSLQKHFKRAERWIVIEGDATITLGDSTNLYRRGDMISIAIEETHCLANHTDYPVEIIEVQLGDYLGEDDIIRYSDKYGRD